MLRTSVGEEAGSFIELAGDSAGNYIFMRASFIIRLACLPDHVLLSGWLPDLLSPSSGLTTVVYHQHCSAPSECEKVSLLPHKLHVLQRDKRPLGSWNHGTSGSKSKAIAVSFKQQRTNFLLLKWSSSNVQLCTDCLLQIALLVKPSRKL